MSERPRLKSSELCTFFYVGETNTSISPAGDRWPESHRRMICEQAINFVEALVIDAANAFSVVAAG
jgi:hypothetical protein